MLFIACNFATLSSQTDNIEIMKIVILAGGSGTRLWPKSRKKKPKQFAKIVNNRTMIENTYDRLMGFFDMKDIYFSTVPEFADTIQKLFPQTPADHIIVEPEKRDNAAAYVFVAAHFIKDYPNEPLAFIPSDHFIKDIVRFNAVLKAAEKQIIETGKMLDIAIEPNFPSTALGYTQVGEKVENDDNVDIFTFKGHTEKPEYDVAQQYLKEGSYLWHASYYMWTAKGFLDAYKKYAPEIHAHAEEIIEGLNLKDDARVREAYSLIEKTSIDFAITEKMDPDDVLIIKGDFGWSDIGAWDVLHDLKKVDHDENQNWSEGNWHGIDTSGSFISAPEGKLVATIGVDDLIIIDTGDALLVCPKSKSQEVKKMVTKLTEEGDIDFV